MQVKVKCVCVCVCVCCVVLLVGVFVGWRVYVYVGSTVKAEVYDDAFAMVGGSQ